MSNEYLRWRYLEHPSSEYKVQVLERSGEPIGVQVARCMRPGMHLMMDQFVPHSELAAVTGMLPPLTVCFVSEHGLHDMRERLVRLPLKKQMPYFFTTEPAAAACDGRHLALSASDF